MKDEPKKRADRRLLDALIARVLEHDLATGGRMSVALKRVVDSRKKPDKTDN